MTYSSALSQAVQHAAVEDDLTEAMSASEQSKLMDRSMENRLDCRCILGATMVSLDHFHHELRSQLRYAQKRGAHSIIVTASELNLAVGGSGDFMEDCLAALQIEIGPGDKVLIEVENRKDLAVRFSLPRLSTLDS